MYMQWVGLEDLEVCVIIDMIQDMRNDIVFPEKVLLFEMWCEDDDITE